MEQPFDQIEEIGKTERRVAMATLIATRGTSPKKEGAKMWVSESGGILGSVTIGGCVDARVIEESEAALASFRPRLLSVDIGEEDAWEGGFTCAGTIQVIIEPMNLANPEDRLLKFYRAIQAEVGSGRCAALATRLEDTSSKLLLYEDGSSSGTLGDAELDGAARAAAHGLIQQRASRTVKVSVGPVVAEIFFEVHAPAPALIIFGAGPVSLHLVNLGRELGLRTIVIDSRPRFANRQRFPHAEEVLIGIPSEIARSLTYTSSTFVVLTAHDYKYDIPVLRTVLGTEAGYIGLLGSRKRGQSILKFLQESGMDERALERVHVPTGLDIGANTAPEIALSILAEAIAVKASRRGTSMSERGRIFKGEYEKNEK
ncbi:MAG: XdhC family protein [Blastocatellia bacterium]|nr:XdhC family protein [Blastocatellia bacterium]